MYEFECVYQCCDVLFLLVCQWSGMSSFVFVRHCMFVCHCVCAFKCLCFYVIVSVCHRLCVSSFVCVIVCLCHCLIVSLFLCVIFCAGHCVCGCHCVIV